MRSATELGTVGPRDDFELFQLPSTRVIGKEGRCGGSLGNTGPRIVEEAFASPQWKLALELPRILQNDVDWMGDHDRETGTFSFLRGVLTPAGTPVPEGLTCRDLAGTACAKGLLGETGERTFARAREQGYVVNYLPAAWNIEVFFPEADASCWIVPVRKL